MRKPWAAAWPDRPVLFSGTDSARRLEMYALLAMTISVSEWLEHCGLSDAMDNWPYMFTAVEMFHYFSFFLVIGTSVLIDLRLLGVAGRRTSMAAFAQQLLPWTWAALSIVIVSGFMMFAPQATILVSVDFFFIKLSGLAVSVAIIVFIQWNVRKWDQSPALPTAAKAAGLVSLLLWIGTLVSALEIAQIANL